MPKKHSSIQAFLPEQLQVLLQVYSRNPKAMLFSGGTYLGRQGHSKILTFPMDIISLKKVEDLKRITRSERYLEIGSAASISSILHLTKRLLPGLLSEALSSIGTPPVRNMATLGGNICVPDRRMDSVPVLTAMDVRLELKTLSRSRIISLARFYDKQGNPLLEKGEVLSRIRIPLEEWNHYLYKKLGDFPEGDGSYLSFCGLAKTQRNIVTDFRVVISTGGRVIIRDRNLEVLMSGRKIPLTEKSILPVMNAFQETLENNGSITPILGARAFRLFKWFTEGLGEE